MKKNHHLLAAAAIIAASVSCSGFEECPDRTESDRTALDVSIMMYETQSKGLVTGTSLPEGSDVGLALYGNDGRIYDNLPYSNVRFSSSGSGSAQTWNPETDVMLSASEAILYAYYPYSSEITDITSIPVTASSAVQTDYMYATPVNGLSNSSPEAAITMYHAMSAIRLSLKRGSYSGTGEVSSVSVKGEGIATEGTLNAMDGSITSISGTGTYIAPEMETFTLSSELQDIDIITIPVNSSESIDMKIVIDGNEFSVTTDPIILEAGKIAVYEATVNNSDISLSSVMIEDWTYNSAGNPIIRHEWTVSLEGDIDGISFANTINDDGSIQIIAVPIQLEATVNPVTIEGDVTVRETENPERGIRTIILSDIGSDISVTFDGCSLWVTATYDITDISSATQVINSYTESYLKRMMVDGEEITPTSSYQFSQTGEHTIKFSFHEYYQYEKIVARFHLPEKGFCNVSTLTSAKIPEGYTLMRNEIFRNCSNLKSVSLPSTLTSIGYNTFYNSVSLEEISFPDNITHFPEHQCDNCTNLCKVKLPANLVNLGTYTFQSCKNLTEIEIPESVTTIGRNAFYNTGLTRLYLPDEISIIPEKMCMNCYNLNEVRLPAKLNEFKQMCFYSCNALNTIIHADGTSHTLTMKIPEGINSIGSLAFYGINFTNIDIPSSLSNISPGGLANSSIQNYTCTEGNSTYDIRSNAIVKTATNTLVAGCMDSMIDLTVTSIGAQAFYGSPIETVDLHAGITNIGDGAFTSATPTTIISRALTPPTLGNSSFWVSRYYGTLKVPADAYDAYNEQWMIDQSGYLGNSTINWYIKTLEDGE